MSKTVERKTMEVRIDYQPEGFFLATGEGCIRPIAVEAKSSKEAVDNFRQLWQEQYHESEGRTAQSLALDDALKLATDKSLDEKMREVNLVLLQEIERELANPDLMSDTEIVFLDDK